MKSIYKKLSVGVLAAALLVGGSGLVQGGQAFAELKEIKESNLDEYLKEAEKREPMFIGYVRLSNRRRVAKVVHEKHLKLKEAINEKGFKEERIYEDGWEFRDDINNIVKKVNSEGKYKVKVGDLYFVIEK